MVRSPDHRFWQISFTADPAAVVSRTKEANLYTIKSIIIVDIRQQEITLSAVNRGHCTGPECDYRRVGSQEEPP
jgi:hypothetical protein